MTSTPRTTCVGHVLREPCSWIRQRQTPAHDSTTPEQGARPMMSTWIEAVCAELNLPADLNVDVILDVARVAAHSVERPAAPVTTFLLGVAVAGGMDVNEAAAKIENLAAKWPTPAV